LFDGHDASINVMRRLIQAEGAEVGRVSMYFHEADAI
jgi:methylmalonyl-CoA mutase cobalamin-binding subunit